MPNRCSRIARLAMAATVLWVIGSRPVVRASEPDGKTETAARASATPIAAALDARIKGKASLDDVAIDLVWEHDRAFVFGTGAVLVDQEVQCRLPRAEVVRILKAVNAARFGSMETRIGHEEEEGGHIEKSATRGILKVAVGPLSKLVLQMRGGEQSKRLETLARTILAASAPCAKTGHKPNTLGDGLADVASGKLAAEALHVLAQRKIDHPGDPAETEGWVLEMQGPLMVSRVLRKGEAPADSRWMLLPPKEMRELAAFLTENGAATLPQNLFATQYTDVRLRILGTNRYVNARPFAKMTPTTHGAQQEAFDRISARLRELGERVRRDGKALIEEMPTDDTEEREREREREQKESRGEKPD